MDIFTLEKVSAELSATITGRVFGRVFQLAKTVVAVDLNIPERRFLYINIEPGDPRIYLIERRFRDLEKNTGNPSAFALTLKKRVSGAAIRTVEQMPNERVLHIVLDGTDELGRSTEHTLIIQLTGRSANLFLLDANGRVIDSLRRTDGEGQEPGTIYSPPKRPAPNTPERRPTDAFNPGEASISAHLDAVYLEKAEADRFRSIANSARSKLESELTKKRQLAKNLSGDLERHGDAEQWKRFGDLLLANAATAKFADGKFTVVDYFDESLAEVEIAADEKASPSEAAESYFRRYTKARNAKEKIAERLKAVQAETLLLEAELERLSVAVAEGDIDKVMEFIDEPVHAADRRRRPKKPETSSGTRRFISSDGLEILVGKKAKDNDYLTFRIAGSLDTWLHAADYPGSHVVIRNPNRMAIPQRTLLEAAELAAFYSRGKAQPKAAVHYTKKKFVNKPKGAAPGLVSLASFKTILVEPKFPDISEKEN